MNPRETSYSTLWAQAVNAREAWAKAQPKNYEKWESKACRSAFGIYKTQCFCERLARAYDSPWLKPSHLEAVRLYLINKHHWHPAQVKDLTFVELSSLLQEELVGMAMTDEEWTPVQHWAEGMDCYSELVQFAHLK